jgi:hypothetical protein
MDQMEPSVHGRTGIIILILVVIGVVVVGAGGYLAWSKRKAEPSMLSAEVSEWCSIRQEWAKKVVPLNADILLKSVSPNDAQEYEALSTKRNQICHEYAAKIWEMKPTDPAIQGVEVALIKEGKVKANIAVEISNVLAQIDAQDTNEALLISRDLLKFGISKRIEEGKKNALREVSEGLKTLQGGCEKIFFGTATDAGTSGNPYISWDELDLRRLAAIKQFEAKIKKQEPIEEYSNRVYHELVRLYRPVLMNCYKRIKSVKPDISDKMGLRIRLKRNGEVKTLAIEWMDNQDERLLDCMLEKAAKWRLPAPDPGIEYVVVKIEFSRL